MTTLLSSLSGRQNRQGISGRPLLGPPRTARSGTESELSRSLSRRACRPFQGGLHCNVTQYWSLAVLQLI